MIFKKFGNKFGRHTPFSDDKDTENFKTGNLVFDFSFFFDKEVIIAKREVFDSFGANDHDLLFEKIGTREHW
ncbi:MAG: hypothetical protein LBH96_04070 [Candidatus Peribacteria bacterium]|nr:hypothetical protein [Candidatus Peribacteria bacterium]